MCRKVGVWTKADSVTLFMTYLRSAVKDAHAEERGQNKFWYHHC